MRRDEDDGMDINKRYRCPFDQVIQAIEDREAGK